MELKVPWCQDFSHQLKGLQGILGGGPDIYRISLETSISLPSFISPGLWQLPSRNQHSSSEMINCPSHPQLLDGSSLSKSVFTVWGSSPSPCHHFPKCLPPARRKESSFFLPQGICIFNRSLLSKKGAILKYIHKIDINSGLDAQRGWKPVLIVNLAGFRSPRASLWGCCQRDLNDKRRPSLNKWGTVP